MTLVESFLTIVFFFAVALLVLGIMYKSFKTVIAVTVVSVAILATTIVFTVKPEIQQPQDTIIIDDIHEVTNFSDYMEIADDYSIAILNIIETANDAIENDDMELARDVRDNAQTMVDELNVIMEVIDAGDMNKQDKTILFSIYGGLISSLEQVINFMNEVI